jgi:peptide deformylase
MSKLNLSIVPLDQIPKGQEVPLDDLLNIFRHALHMQNICLELDGIGLSAVQVGIPWNLFVINDEKEGGIFLNCYYEGIGEKSEDSIEGCLSLKDKKGDLRRFSLKRFNKIRVKGKKLLVQRGDPQFILQEIDKEYNGLFSFVFQHEIDHALGITIDKLGKELWLFK